jgi:predicted nucleic acid-binding protein
MRPVVADTGPLNYLILIEAVDLLPRIFSEVFIPSGVRDELSHPKAPIAVRSWIAGPPEWLNIVSVGSLPLIGPSVLDQGENQAIALAFQQQADIVIDDRDGVLQARKMNLEAIGTLAVLVRASQREWIQLPEMFRRLRATSFRSPVHLMARMLEEDALRKK